MRNNHNPTFGTVCSQELGDYWEKLEELDGRNAKQCDVIFDKTLWCVSESSHIFQLQLGELKTESIKICAIWDIFKLSFVPAPLESWTYII